MNNIDEKAILEWLGFEYYRDYEKEARSAKGSTAWWAWFKEGKKVIPHPDIYSLDWQAKYLWPKLRYLNICYDKKLGFACFVDNGMVCYDETGKDLATTVLRSVMELIGGKK